MAKYVMCAVRDSVADVYGNPFCVQSVGMAVRSFTDSVNKAEDGNAMYDHAEDFALFELGVYDTDTAQIELLERPRQVALGKDVKRKV